MHIIPANVIDNGYIFGSHIKTRNAIEAAVIALGMLIIMKVFLSALPIIIWTILFIVFGLFPALIALIGIGNDSLSEAIRTYRAYKKTKDFLPYSMAQLFPVEEAEDKKKQKKAGKKEKKEEKKAAKEEKKAAKQAAKNAKKAAKGKKPSKGKKKKGRK